MGIDYDNLFKQQARALSTLQVICYKIGLKLKLIDQAGDGIIDESTGGVVDIVVEFTEKSKKNKNVDLKEHIEQEVEVGEKIKNLLEIMPSSIR